MTRVTKESLERRISSLETQREFVHYPLSLNEEYQLEAYKMLLACLENAEQALTVIQEEWSQN